MILANKYSFICLNSKVILRDQFCLTAMYLTQLHCENYNNFTGQ